MRCGGALGASWCSYGGGAVHKPGAWQAPAGARKQHSVGAGGPRPSRRAARTCPQISQVPQIRRPGRACGGPDCETNPIFANAFVKSGLRSKILTAPGRLGERLLRVRWSPEGGRSAVRQPRGGGRPLGGRKTLSARHLQRAACGRRRPDTPNAVRRRPAVSCKPLIGRGLCRSGCRPISCAA